jgi:1-deoxyxylulose-5-phosphate synthase
VQRVKIGSAGVEISRIGLGCVTFGREIDEAQSYRVLDYAFSRGINFLDTAEAYGGGQAEAYRRTKGLPAGGSAGSEMHSSEKIIGRWLRSNGLRGQVALQTKVSRNFTPAHVREALDASLDRLQTDYVDMYLFHSYDSGTPLEQAMEAMAEVVQSGKVCVGGCSNFNAEQLREAERIARERRLPRLETIQPVYNLVRREIEDDLVPFCSAHNIAPVIYSPLGAGFLAGKYAPGGAFPGGSRFDIIPDHADEYFSERNFQTVERLKALSERTGWPMVRLAMTWVAHRPGIAGVLIGARHAGHIDNAVDALTTPIPAEVADGLRSVESAA